MASWLPMTPSEFCAASFASRLPATDSIPRFSSLRGNQHFSLHDNNNFVSNYSAMMNYEVVAVVKTRKSLTHLVKPLSR